jgi:hypothetical protein
MNAQGRARRSAYAEYVALFWRLRRLPFAHPDRPALAAAVAAADARWRSLTGRHGPRAPRAHPGWTESAVPAPEQ